MPCCCTPASESSIPVSADHVLLSKQHMLPTTQAFRCHCQAGASSKTAVLIVFATCCVWSAAADTESLQVCLVEVIACKDMMI